MQPPERRTRADLLIAASIAVIVLLTMGVLWIRSDARATESVTADPPAIIPEPAREVPEVLRTIWDAPSGATTRPVIEGGAVISADGNAVVGHDPQTGEQIWRYARDLELCGVAGAWQRAIAVYRDDRGCSQVTALDGSTGARAASRSSDADAEVTLTTSSNYLVARGESRLESWRSDLVRTVEYGRVDAPVNPGKQPRPGCTLIDAMSSSVRLAVLERCPDEPVERLTLLYPVPSEAQEPEEYSSTVLTEITTPGARLVAVSGERTAVYLPASGSDGPRVGVYDGLGQLVAIVPLPEAATEHAVATSSLSTITWWTGTTVVAFNANDLEPQWSLPETLGPAATMADRLLIPVPTGLAVVDPESGFADRTLAVTRTQTDEAVIPTVIGNVVVEQRGDVVVALR